MAFPAPAPPRSKDQAPKDPTLAEDLREALLGELHRRGKTAILLFLPVLALQRAILGEAFHLHGEIRRCFGFMLAVLVVRLAMMLAAERFLAGPRHHRLRRALFVGTAGLLGAGFAVLNAYAYPHLEPTRVVILAASQTAVNSVAMVSMAGSPAAYLLYMLPNLGSAAFMVARGADFPGRGIFLLFMGIYMVALVAMAFIVHGGLRQNLRLGLELRNMALRDTLTGLRNRRFLDEFLASEAPRVQRAAMDDTGPQGLGLLMVDLDFFKQVNDTYGHAAGDAVLRQLAELLQSVVRKPDLVIRWGGEEFVVVTRGHGLLPPAGVAERIRRRVEAHAFELPGGQTLRRTCSIGYSQYPFWAGRPDALGWEQVLALADCGLYEAKARGRNQVVGVLPGSRRPEQPEDLVRAAESGLAQAEAENLVRVVHLTAALQTPTWTEVDPSISPSVRPHPPGA